MLITHAFDSGVGWATADSDGFGACASSPQRGIGVSAHGSSYSHSSRRGRRRKRLRESLLRAFSRTRALGLNAIVAQMGFLENLVKVFPSLATRPLYLTGESYAGTYIVSPGLQTDVGIGC